MKSSDIEQRERRELSGSSTGMTYHSRAAAEIALLGQGRHTQGAVVTGSARVPQVPRMPEGSPWAGDLVGDEPALGWSVETQEPVGEVFEIAASLNPLGDVAEVARVEEPAQRPAPAADLISRAAGAPSLIRGRRL
jgi:hypothetical protein